MSQISKIPPLSIRLDSSIATQHDFIEANILPIAGLIVAAAAHAQQGRVRALGATIYLPNASRVALKAQSILRKNSSGRSYADISLDQPSAYYGQSFDFRGSSCLLGAPLGEEVEEEVVEIWRDYRVHNNPDFQIDPPLNPAEIQALVGCSGPLLSRAAKTIPGPRSSTNGYNRRLYNALQKRACEVASELQLPKPKFGKTPKISLPHGAIDLRVDAGQIDH